MTIDLFSNLVATLDVAIMAAVTWATLVNTSEPKRPIRWTLFVLILTSAVMIGIWR